MADAAGGRSPQALVRDRIAPGLARIRRRGGAAAKAAIGKTSATMRRARAALRATMARRATSKSEDHGHRLPRFLRSATFRYTALGAVVFALSAGMVLIFINLSVSNALNARADRAVSAEVALLSQAYDRGGLNGLNRTVVQRSLSDTEFLYVLAYPEGHRLSGTLDGLPAEASAPGLVRRFAYNVETEWGEVDRRPARGRLVAFPGGFQLLVGRDMAEDASFLSGVSSASWAATGVVFLLSLGSGAVLSRRFLARLDALNAVAQRVRDGHLDERAPRNFAGDEIDDLGANLNAMWDQIEKLMAAMRHAGDSIAHDLRSPLTRMRARLESALVAADTDADAAALESALADVTELLGTFDAVMRIARLEAGEKRPALKPVDLSELAGDMGELYEPAGEDAGISLTCQIAEDLTVMGDRGLLAQALANLLDNAVKYTPKGGAVQLNVHALRGGAVEAAVTDTGPGIPAEDRERVRQRFVRLEKCRSEPGSGLGLSLVQAVADIHNAELVFGHGAGPVDAPGLRAALVFPAPRTKTAAPATEPANAFV